MVFFFKSLPSLPPNRITSLFYCSSGQKVVETYLLSVYTKIHLRQILSLGNVKLKRVFQKAVSNWKQVTERLHHCNKPLDINPTGVQNRESFHAVCREVSWWRQHRAEPTEKRKSSLTASRDAETFPSSISQLGKGPARPVTTKLRRPCYAEAGVHSISLWKWSSLPLTMSVPGCVVVRTVMFYHPQHLGSMETADRAAVDHRGMAWPRHGLLTFRDQRQQEGMKENTVYRAQMIGKTLHVLYQKNLKPHIFTE